MGGDLATIPLRRGSVLPRAEILGNGDSTAARSPQFSEKLVPIFVVTAANLVKCFLELVLFSLTQLKSGVVRGEDRYRCPLLKIGLEFDLSADDRTGDDFHTAILPPETLSSLPALLQSRRNRA